MENAIRDIRRFIIMANMFSENSQIVLKFLQANQGANVTSETIAEGTGLAEKSVNGILTALQREISGHGQLIERVEVEGFKKKVIRLTAEGAAADPAAQKPEA